MKNRTISEVLKFTIQYAKLSLTNFHHFGKKTVIRHKKNILSYANNESGTNKRKK